MIRKFIILIAILLWVGYIFPQELFYTPEQFENKGGFLKQSTYQAERFHSFDVLHYNLELNFPLESTYFSGKVIIKCESRENGIDSLFFHSVDLIIKAVNVNNNQVNFIDEGDGISIILPETYNTGDTFSVEIDYESYEGRQNIGFFYYDRCAYTMSEPSNARFWFPCYDEPWDKATADIIVTVPDEYKVASNGLLVETSYNSIDNTVTYHWSESYPMATYLFCVTMGKYTTFSDYYITPENDSIEVKYYVFPEDIEKARIDFENVVDMMNFYSTHIHPYPFEKYGMAAIQPFSFGGMEHQTMTTINRGWIRGNKGAESGFAHELAHMWFGDMVTLLDWEHIWLNESFATYFDALYTEYKYGEKQFKKRLKNFKYRVFEEEKKRSYAIFNPPPGYLFGANEYQKGALVLHMLRRITGDEKWWKIIKTYASRFAYKNADTRDFINVCEEVYGKDLDWFFNQWIFGKGYPILSVEWSVKKNIEKRKNIVSVIIKQVQFEAPIFKIPVDITLIGENKEITENIYIDDIVEEFQFEVDLNFLTRDVILDKNEDILKKVTKLAFTCENCLMQNFPNPFNEQTHISFIIGNDGYFELKIYDITGKLVKTLSSGFMSKGNYRLTWIGTNEKGVKVSSGIYIVCLKGNNFFISKKMLYLK